MAILHDTAAGCGHRCTGHRKMALTFIELLLAMAIMAMVGMAVA